MSEKSKMWRVPADLADRVDGLIPLVAADPEFGAGGLLGARPNRSDVLRLLLVRGLASLEETIHTRKKPVR